MRKWLLPRVFERMSAGQGEFLAELRPAVPLFLRFGGIDYDADPDAIAKLDALVSRAQQIVDSYGGNVLQLTIGDKGAYLYAVFGAPGRARERRRQGLRRRARAGRAGAEHCRHRAADRGRRRTAAQRHLRPRRAADVLLSRRRGQPGRAADECRARRRHLRVGRGAPRRQPRVRLGRHRPPCGSPARRPRSSRRRSSGAHGAGRGDTASGDLLGRETELSSLRDLAVESLQGTGSISVITGAGGVGKSRLLSEIGALAGRSGRSGPSSQRPVLRRPYQLRHLGGQICRQAWGIDPTRPYEKVVAQLTEVLGTAGPQRLAAAPAARHPARRCAIPDTALTASLDARLRKTSLESLVVELFEAEPRRPGRSRCCSTRQSTWTRCPGSWPRPSADPSPRTPMLVLLAQRPADADEPPLQALPARPPDVPGRAGRADLPPARRATRSGPWRTRPLPGPALDRLIALAGGNPFHLEELVTFLLDRGRQRPTPSELGSHQPAQSAARPHRRPAPSRRGAPSRSRASWAPGSSPAVVAGSYPELGTERRRGQAAANPATGPR